MADAKAGGGAVEMMSCGRMTKNHEHAYSVLKNAFRHRTVDKTYHALVQGHPDPLEGTIDAPIGRHPKADYKFAVMADGRHSVTHYETLEAHRFASLLEVHLETGRTHQIRVHMAALKHPCVGDLTYGADPTLAARVGLERQWLHAVRLGFEHPDTGEHVEYESTYPDDLAHALEVIRDAALTLDLLLPPGHDGRRRGGRRRPPRRARRRPRCRRRCTPTTRSAPGCAGRLAERRGLGGRGGGRVVGYARLPPTWLDDLYVAPTHAGQGVGSALLDLVKAQRPGRLLPVGLRDEHARARLLRAARPGRARAHRRLRQRGEGAGHPDGLARHRPAARSSAA